MTASPFHKLFLYYLLNPRRFVIYSPIPFKLTLLLQLYFHIRYRQLGMGRAGCRIIPRGTSSSSADRNDIPAATPIFSGSNFLTVVSAILQTVPLNCKSKMAAEKSENGCLYLGLCSSYNQDFAADFDIIKSRRSNGIKVRSILVGL